MNLLIVDDEAVAIKGMLEGIRWKECGIDGSIWTASSAERALKILNVQQVDIMLCDIEMPGTSGLELIRTVRKTNKEMPCIFLTCHASFEYAQEAIRLGCSDYILKPAPYEVIEENLKKVCGELAESSGFRSRPAIFQKKRRSSRPNQSVGTGVPGKL